MAKEIKLWVKARDIVTGFEWIATAITKFLTGCDRVQLTPEAKKWEIKDSCSFDITSLQYVSEWVVKHFNKVEEKVINKEVKRWWPAVYHSRSAY